MSDDADKALTLSIKTPADLKGAIEAQAILQQNITKAKALGQEYGGLQKQVDRVSGSIDEYKKAQGAAGDNTEEAGEKSEKFGLKMGELRKTIREMSAEFPLAGALLKAFVDPIGFMIGSAIAIFAYFKEQISETNKALDEAGKSLAEHDFLPGLEAKKKALADAAQEAAVYADSLRNAVSAADEFNATIKTALDLLHARAAAEKEVMAAEKARALAEIELAEKRGPQAGGITPEEAITRRAGVENAFRDQTNARDKRTSDTEIALKQAQLDKAQKDKEDLAKLVEAREKAADKSGPDRARDEADLEEAKKRAAGLKEAAKKAREDAEEAQAEAELYKDDPNFSTFTAKKAAAKSKDADSAENQNYGEIARLEASIDAVNIDKQKLDQARALQIQNAKDIETLQTDLDRLKAIAGIDDKKDKKVSSIDRDADAAKARGDLDKIDIPGSPFGGANPETIAHLEQLKALHQPLTESQQDQIKLFEQFITSIHGNLEQQINLLLESVSNTKSLAEQNVALKAEIAEIRQLIKGGYNR